jgi:hypothetical protein
MQCVRKNKNKNNKAKLRPALYERTNAGNKNKSRFKKILLCPGIWLRVNLAQNVCFGQILFVDQLAQLELSYLSYWLERSERSDLSSLDLGDFLFNFFIILFTWIMMTTFWFSSSAFFPLIFNHFFVELATVLCELQNATVCTAEQWVESWAKSAEYKKSKIIKIIRKIIRAE